MSYSLDDDDDVSRIYKWLMDATKNAHFVVLQADASESVSYMMIYTFRCFQSAPIA